ncbi:hypothetical protein ACDI60_27130, partial [Klebsiella pneumoniae]|uniref:hypothetical protein n=1 Tax=Klebsiella pneumoniae TaxID=573 RepID=UPI003531EEA7
GTAFPVLTGKKVKAKKVKICSHRLKDAGTQEIFQETVMEQASSRRWRGEEDLEQAWRNFKEVILDSAREACGVSVEGGRKRKKTRWWNDSIKAELKIKREKWQNYLNRKTRQSHNEYKEQRRKVKTMVQEAKQEAWKEFGEFLEDSAQQNQKLFYKVIKNMRNETGKDCPLKFIKDKSGKILTNQEETMERWKEYFAELLNREGMPLAEDINAQPDVNDEANSHSAGTSPSFKELQDA